MGKAAQQKQETTAKGRMFMVLVSDKRLENALKNERPGKPKQILKACQLRRKGMGQRAIAREIGEAYSTICGWLQRMAYSGPSLKRRFDKKPPAKSGSWAGTQGAP